MTKKDYILIADVLIKAFDTEAIDGTGELIELLKPAFKADNPKFDGDKFEDYIWKNVTRKI